MTFFHYTTFRSLFVRYLKKQEKWRNVKVNLRNGWLWFCDTELCGIHGGMHYRDAPITEKGGRIGKNRVRNRRVHDQTHRRYHIPNRVRQLLRKGEENIQSSYRFAASMCQSKSIFLLSRKPVIVAVV